MIVTDLRQELSEILPALEEYTNAKQDFQNHTITQDGVNVTLSKLVVQINEFIDLLYSYSTDASESELLNKIREKKTTHKG